MSIMLQYARWFKSVYRRLREDIALDRRRQSWWAQGVSVSPRAFIRMGENARLEIGRGSLVGDYCILDLADDPLATEPVSAMLKIGERTAVNEFNNIRAAGGEVLIGDNCLLSQFVSIIATNHSQARGRPMREQPWDTKKNRVVIGDDVWIGTHAVLLPGVSVGTGSVIAAGSVVTSDIPDYSVAVGIPAAVIKQR